MYSHRIDPNSLLQELHEAGDDAGGDDLVDGRVGLAGEQLPELGRGVQLQRRVLREERLHHLLRYDGGLDGAYAALQTYCLVLWWQITFVGLTNTLGCSTIHPKAPSSKSNSTK